MSLFLPFGILGQVWYLIVSIPDLCPLLTFSAVYQNNSHYSVLSTVESLSLFYLIFCILIYVF